mmetsp:Transcript_20003/g.59429  ORF Transcript_20003/g.59429 Transcript_20003/m.59429 type:complete len:452 (-) Transcript_20003:374-1729(-)
MTSMTPLAVARAPRSAHAVAIAQLLSVLLAVTGVTSTVLANAGISAPCTQAALSYLLLAVLCGSVHLWQSRGAPRLTNPWYVYAGLALLDLEANYLVTSAYQYTSITSVTLLDSATIPAVMLLSLVVFRSRFRIGHVAGVALCTGGLALLTLTDGASSTGGTDPARGDALVLAGAALYACCNVAQEKLLGDATSRWELLGALGTFASAAGIAQAALLEREQWGSSGWGPWTTAALAGFALCMVAFYIMVPSVLLLASAAALNLNLLTSDLWAAAAREVFFGGFGGTGWAFSVALLAEAGGIALYALSGVTHGHPAADAACAAFPADSAGGAVAEAPGGGVAGGADSWLRLLAAAGQRRQQPARGGEQERAPWHGGDMHGDGDGYAPVAQSAVDDGDWSALQPPPSALAPHAAQRGSGGSSSASEPPGSSIRSERSAEMQPVSATAVSEHAR